MLNRSKLVNAKLRISKLKEKYFTTSNQYDINPDDESFSTGNKSPISLLEDSSPNKHIPRLKVTTVTNNKINLDLKKGIEMTDQNLSTNSNPGSPRNLLTIDIKSSPSDTFTQISEQSCRSRTPNITLKSESLILTDLSNQFENIRFLSSSSDEDENGLSSNHNQNIHFHYLDLEDDIGKKDIDLKVTDKNNEKVQSIQIDNTNSTNGLDSEDGSTVSEIHSEIESKYETQSVESLISKTSIPQRKLEQVNVKTNQSDSSTRKGNHSSNSHQSSKHLNFKTNSTRQTKSEDSIRGEIDVEEKISIGTSEIKRDSFKEKEQKNNVNYTHYLNREQPQKTDPVEKTKIKRRRYKKRIAEHAKEPASNHSHTKSVILAQKLKKIKQKNSELIKEKQTSKSIGVAHKKLYLNSCPLIRFSDLNKEEKDLLLQRFASSNFLFTHQVSLGIHSSTPGCKCDDVWHQLLMNQIQLTRYFIESHHKMYLRCCQAVKMIGDNNR